MAGGRARSAPHRHARRVQRHRTCGLYGCAARTPAPCRCPRQDLAPRGVELHRSFLETATERHLRERLGTGVPPARNGAREITFSKVKHCAEWNHARFEDRDGGFCDDCCIGIRCAKCCWNGRGNSRHRRHRWNADHDSNAWNDSDAWNRDDNANARNGAQHDHAAHTTQHPAAHSASQQPPSERQDRRQPNHLHAHKLPTGNARNGNDESGRIEHDRLSASDDDAFAWNAIAKDYRTSV